MVATLDYKKPTVVIVGHWNAVILNEPGWTAKHILEIPDGHQINLRSVVQVNPERGVPEKQIWLFESFGISCFGHRLELFTLDTNNFQPLYGVVSGIAEKLPHTPVTGVGVNFDFRADGDLAAITPLLETDELFDPFGAIKSQDRTDSIEIPNENLLAIDGLGRPQTILNLTRKTDFTTAEIKFNYHLQLPAMDLLLNWVQTEPISHWKRHAIRMISDCYAFEDINPVYFE